MRQRGVVMWGLFASTAAYVGLPTMMPTRGSRCIAYHVGAFEDTHQQRMLQIDGVLIVRTRYNVNLTLSK